MLLSEKVPVYGLTLTCAIYSGLFEHVIRWKDGPDGTLRFHPTRTEYYGDGEYQISSVCIATLDYPYGVRLPKGMTKAEATGLPLVYSVHGRGEPAWMFCAKNGWDVLQDETRDFVLVVPDSPGNIWQLERDADAFAAMTEKICAEYALDRSRVYLTGFSNGGSITREVGTTHPDWFAAISPWNGPVLPGGGLMANTAIAPTLAESGCELPYWVCVGDSDGATAGRSMEEQLTRSCGSTAALLCRMPRRTAVTAPMPCAQQKITTRQKKATQTVSGCVPAFIRRRMVRRVSAIQ